MTKKRLTKSSSNLASNSSIGTRTFGLQFTSGYQVSILIHRDINPKEHEPSKVDESRLALQSFKEGHRVGEKVIWPQDTDVVKSLVKVTIPKTVDVGRILVEARNWYRERRTCQGKERNSCKEAHGINLKVVNPMTEQT